MVLPPHSLGSHTVPVFLLEAQVHSSTEAQAALYGGLLSRKGHSFSSLPPISSAGCDSQGCLGPWGNQFLQEGLALGQSCTNLTQAFQILPPSHQGPAGGPTGKAFTATQIEKDLPPLLPARSHKTPRHPGSGQHAGPLFPEGAENASHIQRPWWPCCIEFHQSQAPQPLLLLPLRSSLSFNSLLCVPPVA